MIFNSFEYLLFFPIVFAIYWGLLSNSRPLQNSFLLIASYFFYGFWSVGFAGLLILSTLIDYLYGFGVNSKSKTKSKIFLWLSIVNNLGILGLFKYYNFFVVEFQTLFETFGITLSIETLNIVLPIGISFYTFHGMSYVIDIYRRERKPVKNFIDYSLFVSFFPLLVAGPIERANHLLPQIQKNRVFNYSKAVEGCRLIIWGLFKKIVIADNCAYFANNILNNYHEHSGSSLFVGIVFFTIQIYADFSGYSDMASGSAKLLGFDLLTNFRFPYFSRNLAEFWKRWHISLSSWFRDYLYIPLGGSKKGLTRTLINTFIIFIVSGFWHGASWNFIIWGMIHALGFIPGLYKKANDKQISPVVAFGRILPSSKEMMQILGTLLFVMFGWLFFRITNLNDAFAILSKIVSTSLFNTPHFWSENADLLKLAHLLFFTIFCFGCEWWSRQTDSSVFFMNRIKSKFLRYILYIGLIFLCVGFKGENVEFIYFAF
jgi:D-alanyl-lipoteichoic acid acyltransferase DltB (MBOAT superfamily)